MTIALGVLVVNFLFAFIFVKPQYAVPFTDSCGCDYAGWGSTCVSWKPTCNADQKYCIEGECKAIRNEVGGKCGENDDCQTNDCRNGVCQGLTCDQRTSRGVCEPGGNDKECFWYSGYINETPHCVDNNGNMNKNQSCKDGGHCYKDQTCYGGDYCSSQPASVDTCSPASDSTTEYKCWVTGGQETGWTISSNPKRCGDPGASCYYRNISSASPAPGGGTSPEPTQKPGGSTPGGGSTGGSSAPTPTPAPPGDGYCGDSVPTFTTLQKQGNASCATSQSTAIGNLIWQKRGTDPSGYDSYCNWKFPQQRYFYICAPGTGGDSTTKPSSTPTPTPFVPIKQGGVCVASQGPWQCESPNVCLAVPGEGRCCPAGAQWINNQCVTPTSTPVPSAAPAPTTPGPVSTGSTCNDYIPASNIHQVCRVGVSTCMGTEVLNSGGNQACSDFYQKPALCCQLPPSAGPAGGACSNPTRECDLGLNTGTGTNISCSGCGGYCVPNATGGKGTCRNPY